MEHVLSTAAQQSDAPDHTPDLVVAPSFEEFYARELRPAVRLATALTGRRDVGEELVQDAFFDAYRKWGRIGRYDNPATWVRRAVLNRAVSLRRRTAVELKWMVTRRRQDDDPGAFDADGAEVWNQVRRLPRRQAQVVVLHYVEQLTTEEIADVLGITPPSIKTHLQRARATLAERLEQTDA